MSVSVAMKMSSSDGTSSIDGHEVNGQLSYADVHIAPFMVTIVLISYSASNVWCNEPSYIGADSSNQSLLDKIWISRCYQQCYYHSVVSLFLVVRTAYFIRLGCYLGNRNYWSRILASILWCWALKWTYYCHYNHHTLCYVLLGIFFLILPVMVIPHCQSSLTKWMIQPGDLWNSRSMLRIREFTKDCIRSID